MTNPVRYKTIHILEFMAIYGLNGAPLNEFLTDANVVNAMHQERLSGWEFIYIHGQNEEASVVFREVQ